MDVSSLPNEAWVGIFLPLVIAFVQNWHLSRQARTFIAFWCCFVVALIMHIGKINDIDSFLVSLTSILTMTGVFYRAYWLPSGIAPAIDKATSPDPKE